MMKRHGDDGYGYGAKRQRGPGGYERTLPPGKTEIRMLIQSKAAGGVIGKGGDNIKRLRSQYDATLTVPDSNSPERVLTIVADTDKAVECCREILPRLDEIEGRKSSSTELEARLLVHQSHAGAIIGRGGFKIKELRDQTNTQLKVYSQCCPLSTDRVLAINGELEKIVDAIRAVVHMLVDIPVKGVTKLYDTINCDPAYVNEYGGFNELRGGFRGNINGGGKDRPFRDNFGGGRGGGRSGGRDGGYGGRRDYGPPPYDRGPPLPPPRDYGGYGGGGGGGPYGGPPDGGGPLQTTQVTIPAELGGTIIGKGGDRINRIREESGAHIVVDPTKGVDERIITISGTQSQIQTAQYLLQQCVRQSPAGRKYLNER